MMEVAESKRMSARVRTCVENSLRRDTAAHTDGPAATYTVRRRRVLLSPNRVAPRATSLSRAVLINVVG